MRDNPFKLLRLAAGLTQDQLASRAGVTRQVVTLTEQGLYKTPPVSLLAAFTVTRIDLLSLDYFTWQIEKRASNGHMFRRVNLDLAKNPWSGLKNQVAGTSQQGFCRALVYQPSLIREYEMNNTGLPGIVEALRQCELSEENIERLTSCRV